ncbi:hypothetical protein [Novosphingobium sp. FKTRR1]|uniref:hypothetical protein n=1 Tax=Novosphingobium sp. FKTRR1 TaxID=2879118 RepID=UPI001CF082BD|nr:hypothetical protein [Novosphingobium sp. FKTRR1]
MDNTVHAQGRSGGRWLVGLVAAAAMIGAPIAVQAHPGGWGGGWGNGHPYHERHDRGPDAGEVIAGLLVIGGIAAIATSIANKNKRDEATAASAPPPYPQDQPSWAGSAYSGPSWQDRDARWDAVPPATGNYGWTPGAHDRGLDNAVEACAARARDRGGLDQIWDAARQGDGYRVRGNLDTGNPFICNVDQSGRVTDLTVSAQDGRSTAGPGAYGSPDDARPTATGLGRAFDNDDGPVNGY